MAPRMATYNDLERALRAMLCTQCGLSVAEAAAHSPLWILPRSGIGGDSASQGGIVDTRGLGALGQWTPGSSGCYLSTIPKSPLCRLGASQSYHTSLPRGPFALCFLVFLSGFITPQMCLPLPPQ